MAFEVIAHPDRRRFAIRGHYSNRLRDVCRHVPGMDWDYTERVWVGYADAVSVVLSEMDRRFNIRIPRGPLPSPGEHIPPWVAIARKGRGGKVLRDYQVKGAEFLLSAGQSGAILADEMGCGKTSQAIVAARAYPIKTIIICPSFAKGVWVNGLRDWWPAALPCSLPEGQTPQTSITHLRTTRGRPRPPPPAPKPSEVYEGGMRGLLDHHRVAILHYEIVQFWLDVLLAWGGEGLRLILDEPHCLQDAASKRVRAIKRLAQACQTVAALTGTPLVGKPKTLWTLVDTISPGRFGRTFFNYGMRYCEGRPEQVALDEVVYRWDGTTNVEELAGRLKYFVLRRTKQDVRLELPAKTRQVVELEVPVRARIMPGLDVIRKSAELRRHLDLAADAKLPQIVEAVEEQANGGHRVVVFTHRKKVAEMICNAMRGFGLPATFIHGELPLAKRERRLDEARASTGPHVLCATIDTVSTAIDLTYADVAVFAELPWEAWKLAQAEARLARPGQTRATLFLYPIAKCTADEIILSCVIRKLDIADRVVGPAGDKLAVDLSAGPEGQDALDALYRSILKKQRRAT